MSGLTSRWSRPRGPLAGAPRLIAGVGQAAISFERASGRVRVALVVLLRGVNVGGHRTFRPKSLVEQLTHFDAVNIGAAGTFVIRRLGARAHVRAELARRLPFDAEIMICEAREMVGLMSRHPLANKPVRPDIVRFVSVLSRRPRSTPSLPIRLPSTGRWLLKILAREGVTGIYRGPCEDNFKP